MKVKLVSIQFPFSESIHIDTSKIYCNFEDANAQLSFACRRFRGNCGYDKTDFILTYADGYTYKGRYDISPDNTDTLQQHVKSFCECYGGIKKPYHLSEKDWEMFEKYPEYAEFLEKYEL